VGVIVAGTAQVHTPHLGVSKTISDGSWLLQHPGACRGQQSTAGVTLSSPRVSYHAMLVIQEETFAQKIYQFLKHYTSASLKWQACLHKLLCVLIMIMLLCRLTDERRNRPTVFELSSGSIESNKVRHRHAVLCHMTAR
jgi:hypothetical protein